MRWYDDDTFWEMFESILFGPERWASTAAGIDLLLERASLPPGGAILDLCCGPGRHCLELARRGFRMTGVDRTRRYLDSARRRAAAEGLAIEFVEQDMRSFRRDGAFDGAINLFTSFGYFEDPGEDRRVVENLHASLRAGGILLMDLMGKEILARTFRPRDWNWIGEEGGAILLEERKLSLDWGWIETTWTLLEGSERQSRTLSHRLYSGSELGTLLRSVGFRDVKILGGMDGAGYDHLARRLVAVAVR